MPMRTRNVTRPGSFDDSLDQPRGPARTDTFGIVLMRLRVAEINQHAVAHVFRDEAVETGDSVGDRAGDRR